MGRNGNLLSAKRVKNDEFYTRFEDIETELEHYKDYFRGKVVYCPCDDPKWSNFPLYFALNFHKLGLKRLICSCYYAGEVDLMDLNAEVKQGYKFEYNGELADENEIREYLKNCQEIKLKGCGDFRSLACLELLKQADVVVTNPPFSLFREFYSWCRKNDKKFLVIGNMVSATYKNVFPDIKNGELFLGYQGFKGTQFTTKNGESLSVAGVWWQNIKRHERWKTPLILTKSYYENPSLYPKYDNYNAINVDKVADIPFDYDGVIGVPVSFLDAYFTRGFLREREHRISNSSLEIRDGRKRLQTERKRNLPTNADKESVGFEIVGNTEPFGNETGRCVCYREREKFYVRLLVRILNGKL